MGNCASDDSKLAVYEQVANNLRRDLNEVTESLKSLQSSLKTPQGKEELEALRLQIAGQREIEELKTLVAIQSEVNSLKLSLGCDPSFVASNIQQEITALQRRIDASKALQAASSSLNDSPPFLSVRFDKEITFGAQEVHSDWRIKSWKANSFILHQNGGIEIITSGFYQTYLTFTTRGGRHNYDRCVLLVDGQEFASRRQEDHKLETSMLVNLFLKAGQTITVSYTSTMNVREPRLMPSVDADFILLSKQE